MCNNPVPFFFFPTRRDGIAYRLHYTMIAILGQSETA